MLASSFIAGIFSLLTLNSPGPKPVINNSSINKIVLLQMVNKVRQRGCSCGNTYYPPVSPLVWNDKLEQAALRHSSDMYRRNYFNHVSPDGVTGEVRIAETAYKWRAMGENIAFGYHSEKEVIEGWIKSPGHCQNIMNRQFKEMAVARAGNYWTQTFGAQ